MKIKPKLIHEIYAIHNELLTPISPKKIKFDTSEDDKIELHDDINAPEIKKSQLVVSTNKKNNEEDDFVEPTSKDHQIT